MINRDHHDVDILEKVFSCTLILVLGGIFIFPSLSFSGERVALSTKRNTPTAPDEYLRMKNPVPSSTEVLKEAEGLYKSKCRKCHGTNGTGKGSATKGMKIKPRDYTDRETMEKLSDGQLFWIILNGSDPKTTEMEAFKKKLTEEDAWKLVHYIRSFTNNNNTAHAK